MSILCTLCGKEYPTEKHLQIHIANTDCNNEDEQVKRKCSTCEQEILGNRKYLNHLATHETISCKHCKIEIPKNSRTSHTCKKEKPKAKIVGKKGTPQPLIQSKRTLTGYNSRRAGFSPAYEMTIHNKASGHSKSTPLMKTKLKCEEAIVTYHVRKYSVIV